MIILIVYHCIPSSCGIMILVGRSTSRTLWESWVEGCGCIAWATSSGKRLRVSGLCSVRNCKLKKSTFKMILMSSFGKQLYTGSTNSIQNMPWANPFLPSSLVNAQKTHFNNVMHKQTILVSRFSKYYIFTIKKISSVKLSFRILVFYEQNTRIVQK